MLSVAYQTPMLVELVIDGGALAFEVVVPFFKGF
jgi:hypothetical protein